MAAPRGVAVVPGEASESDSDAELDTAAPACAALAGLKVPGEASETDTEEEEEAAAARPKGPLPAPDLPPLVVERRPEPLAAAEEKAAPWGGSLLQQRLLEGNARLRGAVGGAVGQGYAAAARHLGALAAPLGRAQAAAAAASHSLRLARRDLRAVAAAVDIVAGCGLLPDIRGDLLPP